MIATCVVALLAGCTSYYVGEDVPPLTKSKTVGTWVHLGPAGAAATFKLEADGSFTATGLPMLRTPTPDDVRAGVKDDTKADWSVRMHGSGTWGIDSSNQDQGVDLDYDTNSSDISLTAANPTPDPQGGNYSHLWSLGVQGHQHLFVAVGDMDAKYRFDFRKQSR